MAHESLKVAGNTGFEPVTNGLTVRCSTSELIPLKVVGIVGFEPTTPWSQTKCSTKLS